MSDEVSSLLFYLKTSADLLPFQLAQDDDGFEIRSIADSLDDEDDDEEAARKDHERALPPTGGASTSVMDSLAQEPPPLRKPSAAPALQNSSQAPPPIAPPRSRMSLDGETIFAVGDEGGEWSDGEEESDDERKKLTGRGL